MSIRLSGGKLRLRGGKPALVTAGAAQAQPPVTGPAATSLSLADVVDGTIMQRAAGATYKDVQVPFTYTGPAATVQARMVDASGAEIVPWTTIATNPTGGAGSGVLRVPQGKWGKLQIRDGNDNSIVSNGANEFAVGAIFLWSGQSNMVNTFTTADKYPTGSKNARAYDATNNRRGILGNRATSGAMPSAPFILFGQGGYPSGPPWTNDVTNADAPVYFANMLAQELGVPVLIVLSAYGGQSIDTWVPTTGINWPKLAAAVAAVGGDIEGMDWSQAEADTLTKTVAQMRAKWDGLQAQMLDLLAPFGRTKSNFKMGMISLGACDGSYAKSGVMRANQTDYANTTAGWFLASSAYDGNTPADHVHQDGPPLSRVYRRAARSALAAVYGIGASGAGPKIDPANVKLNGSDIFANVIHAGGTALADGAGGTGASVTSLEVKDSTGAVIPYVLQVTAAAQFKLSLTASFVAPLTVSNAYMDVPCGAASGNGLSFDPARCLYDNLSYVNKTMGGAPLQPCAPIAVS
jgi:hypothetical protein